MYKESRIYSSYRSRTRRRLLWAICPEVPGANGQGDTIQEAKNSLRQAIELILEDRKADILRGLPEDAIQENVMVG